MFNKLRLRRVPVVFQLSAVDCGAACLAMILQYYGRYTTLVECRDIHGVGRDGMSALQLAKVARTFGLNVKAYTLEPTQMSQISLPAIAYWDFKHFLIIEQWTPKSVTIVDPAEGRQRLSAQTFDEKFTGVVLTFSPGVDFQKRPRNQKHPVIRYLFNYLRTVPGILGQIILATFLLQLLGLGLPIFTQILIDDVLPFRLDNMVKVLGVGMFFWLTAQVGFSYLRSLLLIRLGARLDAQVVVEFFRHLLSLPFLFFQQRASGDLLMRLTSNVTIREVLTGQILSLVMDTGLLVGYLAILLFTAPQLGLLVIGLGAIQVALVLKTNGLMYHLSQRSIFAQATSQSYLVEALRGVATLKVAGSEDRALSHWSNLYYDTLNASIKRDQMVALVEISLTSVRLFTPLLFLWIGTQRVFGGSLTIGELIALNVLAGVALNPLSALLANVKQFQTIGAHIERLEDVLNAPPEQPEQANLITPDLQGAIDIHDLSFRYGEQGHEILRNISLHVAPNTKLAIVGRTGSGKSTLAKLLLGLYPAYSGEIFYDGILLQQMNYKALRKQMGVVLQESMLFSGSIRNNIGFNNPQLSFAEIVKAAQLAEIHDEIQQMPMKYETSISEGGAELSGGQRQRILLARALANKPAILLLDEATSHLDAVTERRIQHHLEALACTQIIIAHRLSTIQNADCIVVLDQGEIIEKGTHNELIELEGYYASLVNSQHGAPTPKHDVPFNSWVTSSAARTVT